MVRQALIRHLVQVISKNDTSFDKSQVASRKSQVANMMGEFEILKSTD